MTRRLRTDPAWRRVMDRLRGPWVTTAPGDDVSVLDVADGVRPCGEVLPEGTQQALVRRHVSTVYDQEFPVASEVEAWLAGGAR